MKKNLVYALGVVMIGAAVHFLATANYWWGFLFLSAGMLTIMRGSRGRKMVYRSGDPVIRLAPVYEGGLIVYCFRPVDPQETRQARIERNFHYPALGTAKWQLLFLEDAGLNGSSWKRTEYGRTAGSLVPLAVGYIMRDRRFKFKWDGKICKRQFLEKE